MPRIRRLIVALFALLPLALLTAARRTAEKRIALVIGNAGYQAGALATPANDAGLIAQTLQAAGFDVVGARDLDQDSLRHAFRDFLEKAIELRPGHRRVRLSQRLRPAARRRKLFRSDRREDRPRRRHLRRGAAHFRLHAARLPRSSSRRASWFSTRRGANPFAKAGPPLAGGLALVEPEPGLLIAFNAAPGHGGSGGARVRMDPMPRPWPR